MHKFWEHIHNTNRRGFDINFWEKQPRDKCQNWKLLKLKVANTENCFTPEM